MELRVHTVGGVLGLDRTVRVDAAGLTVTEPGRPDRSVPLPAERHDSILRAADRVLGLPAGANGPGPDDGDHGDDGWATDVAHTEIAITDGAATHRWAVTSGEKAAAELYRLLDLVDRAASP